MNSDFLLVLVRDMVAHLPRAQGRAHVRHHRHLAPQQLLRQLPRGGGAGAEDCIKMTNFEPEPVCKKKNGGLDN